MTTSRHSEIASDEQDGPADPGLGEGCGERLGRFLSEAHAMAPCLPAILRRMPVWPAW